MLIIRWISGLLVTPGGLEPPTDRTGICYSIQLNYGAVFSVQRYAFLIMKDLAESKITRGCFAVSFLLQESGQGVAIMLKNQHGQVVKSPYSVTVLSSAGLFCAYHHQLQVYKPPVKGVQYLYYRTMYEKTLGQGSKAS